MVWNKDFKRCLDTTFWYGWMLNASFAGIAILGYVYYPSDTITPRVIEALCEMVFGLLFVMLIFASFMQKPSPGFMIQNNFKLVSIEFLRTVLRTLVGFVCFIIPGIYLTVRYIFVPFVVMGSRKYQEGKVDALKESWKLSTGIMWPLAFCFIFTQLFVAYLELGLAPTLNLIYPLARSEELMISTIGQVLLSYPVQVFLYLIIARLFLLKMNETEASNELAIQLARD